MEMTKLNYKTMEKYTLTKIEQDGSAKTFIYKPTNTKPTKKELKDKLVEILMKIKTLTSEKLNLIYFLIKVIDK
jgi:predicted transcriptional regulator